VTIFGPMVPDTVVEDLVTATLKKWFGTYLGELERVTGRARNSIASPRWGVTVESFHKRPEQTTPFVTVLSAGITQDPVADGEGLYRAWFGIEVTVTVSASTAQAVESLAKLYATTADAVVVQKLLRDQPADGPLLDLIWHGHAPEDMGDTDRSMLSMTSRFSVLVASVLQRGAGPLLEDDSRSAPGDWPEYTQPPELTVNQT
jgi:hypothetical protein